MGVAQHALANTQNHGAVAVNEDREGYVVPGDSETLQQIRVGQVAGGLRATDFRRYRSRSPKGGLAMCRVLCGRIYLYNAGNRRIVRKNLKLARSRLVRHLA